VFGGERWKKNVLMTSVACPGYDLKDLVLSK